MYSPCAYLLYTSMCMNFFWNYRFKTNILLKTKNYYSIIRCTVFKNIFNFNCVPVHTLHFCNKAPNTCSLLQLHQSITFLTTLKKFTLIMVHNLLLSRKCEWPPSLLSYPILSDNLKWYTSWITRNLNANVN